MNIKEGQTLTEQYNKQNTFNKYCTGIFSKIKPFFNRQIKQSKIKVKQLEEQLKELKPTTNKQLKEKLKLEQSIKDELRIQTQQNEFLIEYQNIKKQKRIRKKTAFCNECFITKPKTELLKFGIRPLTNTLFCKECYEEKHRKRQNGIIAQIVFSIVVVIIIAIVLPVALS